MIFFRFTQAEIRIHTRRRVSKVETSVWASGSSASSLKAPTRDYNPLFTLCSDWAQYHLTIRAVYFRSLKMDLGGSPWPLWWPLGINTATDWFPCSRSKQKVSTRYLAAKSVLSLKIAKVDQNEEKICRGQRQLARMWPATHCRCKSLDTWRCAQCVSLAIQLFCDSLTHYSCHLYSPTGVHGSSPSPGSVQSACPVICGNITVFETKVRFIFKHPPSTFFTCERHHGWFSAVTDYCPRSYYCTHFTFPA